MKTIHALCFFLTMSLVSLFPVAASAESITKQAVVEAILKETRNSINPVTIKRIVNAAFSEAKKYNLDPFTILSFINVESKFRPDAKNKSGASGLMQVIPRWHKDKIKGRNIFNIETNIEVGTKVYADCLNKTKNQIKRAFACYSGGANKYKEKIKAGHTWLTQADVLYRFENEKPLIVSTLFSDPYSYKVMDSPKAILAEAKPITKDIDLSKPVLNLELPQKAYSMTYNVHSVHPTYT